MENRREPEQRPVDGVLATVQYLARAGYGVDSVGATATYQASVAGGAVGEHEGEFDRRTVSIADGRQRAGGGGGGEFDLDREGFRLVDHDVSSSMTSLTDFYDDALLSEVYDTEVKNLLLRKVHGASRVHVFDHTRRSSSSATREEKMVREPASIVHNDYTEMSANVRLVAILGEVGASEALGNSEGGRFAIVNVWRSIGPDPVQSSPLALCDSTTVDDELDLVSVKRVSRDRVGEIQMAHFSPRHRWYHFPGMRPDEAILIKTFDSSSATKGNDGERGEEGGIARFTIHTAFHDPTAPDGAPPRESLETRAFVFF